MAILQFTPGPGVKFGPGFFDKKISNFFNFYNTRFSRMIKASISVDFRIENRFGFLYIYLQFTPGLKITYKPTREKPGSELQVYIIVNSHSKFVVFQYKEGLEA